jgi:ABC-type lipoprotein release transport system permease subunit
MATQKVLEQFLYQVDATDPLIILAVCVLLGSLATAATLLPARRAAKLDPVTALR